MTDRSTFYVGLWPRCLAFAADYLLIAAYLIILICVGLVVNGSTPSVSQNLFGNPLTGQVSGFFLITLPVIIYFGLAEASHWQASWGKRRMHLKVAVHGGNRLGLGRALGRTVLKFIPWELSHTLIWQISFASDWPPAVFVLGFVLVWLLVGANVVSLLLSPSHQTLYDRITRTFVLRETARQGR